MTLANALSGRPAKRHAQVELDRRYGRIGISAVAAALHYQSETKNPAYAPAEGAPDERLTGAATA